MTPTARERSPLGGPRRASHRLRGRACGALLSGRPGGPTGAGPQPDHRRRPPTRLGGAEEREQVPLRRVERGALGAELGGIDAAADHAPTREGDGLYHPATGGAPSRVDDAITSMMQGAPLGRFLAATNRNDVFGRWLASGRLRPQAAVATPSNAMDVGDPSNAARIQALYGGDLKALRHDVASFAIDDETTFATISAQTSVVTVKPGGTGMSRQAISARLQPLPPRRLRIVALPSLRSPPNEVILPDE